MAQNLDQNQNNELVLNPIQYAFVLDKTKGIINTLVGPTKQQIAPNTEQPIKFNRMSRKFEDCALKDAVQEFIAADEGSYIVLEGTTKDGTPPPLGTVSTAARVDMGRKVMLPGPQSFPVWPSQIATVVNGHHLKTNEYLICRVYNDDEAKKNWNKAILRKRTLEETHQLKEIIENADSEKDAKTFSLSIDTDVKIDVKKDSKFKDSPINFVMGQLLIIKGTEIAYFVPPTGIEVLPQNIGKSDYVRSAVTLEKLDYCILLSESGHKRYVQGPAVVFPESTETFFTREEVSREGAHVVRKFKAYELTENMGLHIKVIEAYQDLSKFYKEGDELFITGKEQPIYFPRKEHSVIRYGEQDVQFAVAVPAGEGRYVLDKTTGKVNLIIGPQMLLPDPRSQVIVRRILTQKECELYFPGNQEALHFNLMLQQELQGQNGDRRTIAHSFASSVANSEKSIFENFKDDNNELDSHSLSGRATVADEMKRSNKFTPPRSIVLNTKYDGAVTINIWNGYAVLVVGSDGKRRVVTGPSKLLLQYDEVLEPQSFSTGKPKNTDNLFKTVYLKYQHNQVSDIIPVTTKDLVKVQLKVSFRVNFEGGSSEAHSKWFAVDNYVKFLCDRMRSMLNNAAMKVGIEEFMNRSHDLVRDTVLGEKVPDKAREGRFFSENGIRIYDVELLKVTVGDPAEINAGNDIITQLTAAQHATITNMIRLKAKEAELQTILREEKIKQDIEFAKQDTQDKVLILKAGAVQKNLELDLAKQNAVSKLEVEKLNLDLTKQKQMDDIQESELSRRRAVDEMNLAIQEKHLNLSKDQLVAETTAFKEKAAAVSDKMLLAIQAASDKSFAASIAQATAPIAYLRNTSASDAFNTLVHGLPVIGDIIGDVVKRFKVEEQKLESTKK